MKRISTVICFVLLIVTAIGATPVHAQDLGMYTVRPEDTMLSIAARFGVSASELARANGLAWDSWVYAGQRLMVPDSGGAYVVQRGDTLYAIARHFGTTVHAIMEANGLANDRIYAGQILTVPGPQAASCTTYVVRQGDTLYSIALRFSTSVPALMEANALTTSQIYSGQSLRIPGCDASSSTTYVVRPGDTLHSISRRFGISVQALIEANNLYSTTIYVDQRLVVPGHYHVPGEATVTISPTSGPPGTMVQVSVTGFPSHTEVSVGVGPEASEFSEAARGTTDAHGRFTVHIRAEGGRGMGLVFAVAAEGRPGVTSPDVFRITH